MLCALVATLAMGPLAVDDRELVLGGLGPHRRTITSRSADAQKFFNQGLNILFGFNHDEAIRSFTAATQLDPNCAIAWWGVAYANGGHINNPYVPPERERAAVAAIRKAMALSNSASPVERALIQAMAKRYTDPPAEDRAPLEKAYSDEMAIVWKRFPNDPDVGVIYAESLMNLQPWDYWTQDYKPKGKILEITRVIDRVLKLKPNHPQALHLAIHAWEASATPARAVAAADRLRDLQPGLGHMVHMPSHIDVVTGEWRKAVIANEKAIAADAKYQAQRPEQGFYRIYMAHNRHMLAHAAIMLGQRTKAVKAMDEMVAAVPPEVLDAMAPVVDGFLAMPFEVRIRFGMWDEILDMPEVDEKFPLTRALRFVARGVALAAKGEPAQARMEQARFAEAKTKVPAESTFGNNQSSAILAVADPMLEGEILLAEGDFDGAVGRLKIAVSAEDALRYDEPPGWIIPVRHALGAALLRMGKPKDAEAVYREDLRRLPNNGWALFGLSQALKAQGKSSEAARVEAKFKTIWAEADTQITSSCLCLPGR